MSFKIIKFGGTSIADAEKIQHVAGIIEDTKKNSELAIVVSAFGGVTDTIKTVAESAAIGKDIDVIFNSLVTKHTKCAEELSINNEKNIRWMLNEYFTQFKSDLLFIVKERRLSSQSLDKILSYGELLSTTIVAEYLSQIGMKAEMLDARKVILTDNHFGYASVYYKQSYDNINTYCKERKKIQVITGFLGATKTGENTTLGRSGSDYTAAIFGAALNADSIEIWTDVDGLLSADPNIIQEAKTIPFLTYEEAFELAHAGAKVIFPPTIIPAMDHDIPIYIKNYHKPNHHGTHIKKNRELINYNPIGISSLANVSIIRIQGAGMLELLGTLGRIFSSLAKIKININLVSMSFSEHSICFAINSKWISKAVKTIETEFSAELKSHYVDKIKVEDNLCLVAVVGEGMRHASGFAGRVFSSLGDNKINVIAIAQGSSKRNISFIIDEKNMEQALRVLHTELFTKRDYIADIYQLGVGTIGTELLNIINKENPQGLSIHSVASSKKMLIMDDTKPINIKNKLYKSGISLNLDNFFNTQKGKRSRQKIFVDCTASKSISKEYVNIMNQGFSIVTANKIANTLDQDYYYSIRDTAKKNNVQFRYETNVGAGLPIINTLRGLITTGDKILRIEGVLSGTLSFLFNAFNGQKPFSSLVKEAREKGFTEPDPREDLSGMDVARKILILARETGAKLELNDIYVDSLIPDEIDQEISVDKFLNKLVNFDKYFQEKLEKAVKEQKVLRYIGSWDGERAKIGLESIGNDNPLYNQKGRENFIVFRSLRYNDVPLVIKGHGAGSSVTAAGVLNDIQLCLEDR